MKTLHHLPILTSQESERAGYVSITTDINSNTESAILASVCQHRNPRRTCLIRTGTHIYQLAVKHEDLIIIP
jgi:hypothetical protein